MEIPAIAGSEKNKANQTQCRDSPAGQPDKAKCGRDDSKQ
jgi:hypothetical protein